MFSFFRKTKREPDAKSNDEVQSPTQNMCKNKAAISAQGGTVPDIVLPDIAVCESATPACDAVNRNTETIEYFLPNDTPTAPMRRASSTSTTRNVKPCGHGTVAISPRIPPPNSRLENNPTPPGSPKLDTRNYDKSRNNHEDVAIFGGPATLRHHGGRTGSLKEQERDHTKPRKLSADFPTSLCNGNKAPVIDEDEKKSLINQEAKFQSQLNELSKQLSQRDGEANKLRFQMDDLQRDVFTKSAGIDRLQAELQAAHKESEYVKQRLRNIEEDLRQYRLKNSDISEELVLKTESLAKNEAEATTKINELEAVIRQLKDRIESLELQIEELKTEKRQLETQHEAILAEREQEKLLVEIKLEEALKEKDNVNKRWEDEFEKLRTVNILKEQQLLDDFEWQLREVHKSCKKKLMEKERSIDEKLKEAYKEAEEKMKIAQNMMDEVEHLKEFEVEVEDLKDKTKLQEKSLEMMKEQHEQMQVVEQSLKDEAKKLRSLIELEKENLEHMQRMHHQEIVDKERWLQHTLEEKKTEIAIYWEERLLHEIGRLKYELEQMYFEEKHAAIENIRRQKEEEFEDAKLSWQKKIEECIKEITALKTTLEEKETFYHKELISQQTITDRDILELRRIMDKIDDAHHERFEKLVNDHEKEIDVINTENESRLKELETNYKTQVDSLRTSQDSMKEEMEEESQRKIESLIEQHRSELDTQWANLVHQKSEAIRLVEHEYVGKYKTLEEQFYTQQKSHEAREIELLKTVDSLKNDLESKSSTMEDLQNNVDVLEGGVQVLHQEIAHQGEQLVKNRRDADNKIRGLQDVLMKLQALQEQERDEFQNKLNQQQTQAQGTIDHLQRKCNTLTKLFEEVRMRYERRDSRQEDINMISDLRQIIAEQEKDMACMNEEKRYYQLQLMKVQRKFDDDEDDDDFHDPDSFEDKKDEDNGDTNMPIQTAPIIRPQFVPTMVSSLSIPPTIPECDDCDEE